MLEISDLQALTALEGIAGNLGNLGALNILFRCMILDGEPPGNPFALHEIKKTYASVLSDHKYFLRRIECTFQAQPPGGGGSVAFSRQANGSCNDVDLAVLLLDGRCEHFPNLAKYLSQFRPNGGFLEVEALCSKVATRRMPFRRQWAASH